MKKRIIATGISGLIGSRIVELLGKRFNFISFSLDTGVDITDFSKLKSKFDNFPGVDVILHLAAFTDVTAAWMQKGNKNGSCYRVNVMGSKNIAQLAFETKKYLIHISTDFVFDGKNPPAGGYTETDESNPIEWYGKTKLWAEKEIKKSGCNHIILRPSFPFKAKIASKELEPQPKLDLVRTIINKLKKKEELKMFTDQIITPTFIDDISRVIEKCIDLKPKGIFHCVGSTSLSPYQIAVEIAKIFNLDQSLIKQITLIDYFRRSSDSRPRQKNMALSNKKLERELKIKMLTFHQALEEMKRQLG